MTETPFVRLAEIEIDPAFMAEYRQALADGIRLAMEREPGVLVLDAMSPLEAPHLVRVFEVYRDRAAYEIHITTPHFLAYKDKVAGMVRSLTLLDAGWSAVGSLTPKAPQA